MMNAKKLALAFAATCALSTSALAADEMMMKDGSAMVVMPDGKMSTMSSPDKATMDTMMKEGKPMTGAMMMMMSGGKMHMMEDKKMTDGKMMSEHMTMSK